MSQMLARITVVKAVAFSDSADQLMVGAASFPLVVAAQVDGRHRDTDCFQVPCVLSCVSIIYEHDHDFLS